MIARMEKACAKGKKEGERKMGDREPKLVLINAGGRVGYIVLVLLQWRSLMVRLIGSDCFSSSNWREAGG